MLVNGTDLDQWAQRREAQSLLPGLIRRLLRATTSRTDLIDIPSDEGIQRRGWDCIVVLNEGNEYFPTGISGCEISCHGQVTRKANQDYDKRTSDAQGYEKSETTFIFITARRWEGKRDWISAKNSEGVWRGVRAFDADDISSWLELAPAVHCWISAKLGKYPRGAIDLETHWDNLSVSTRPHLTPEFILAGREEIPEQIHNKIIELQGPLTIKAGSKREALAVFAASILSLSSEESQYLLSRSIIVHDIFDWNQLASLRNEQILIPSFHDPEAVSLAVRNNHKVIIPLDRSDSETSSTFLIPKISSDVAASLLVNLGLNYTRAVSLAILARKSFTAFFRRISIIPEGQRPDWASPENGPLIASVMLFGAWEDNRLGDQQAIATLTQIPYSGVISTLVRWSNEVDPPVIKLGETWSVTSKEDIWDQLARFLDRSTLERFQDIAIEILSIPNPKFDLPNKERWMAAIYGAMDHSSSMYAGIAESLAIMGGFEDIFSQALELPLSSFARQIVSRILENANTDWRIWASLSEVLPYIAEASPDTFLSSLDDMLENEDVSIHELFTDNENTVHISSPHTGLLWALETLAWSPQHLGYSSCLLAKLARIDPGGKLSNRPFYSLYHIFYPGKPQTMGLLARRLSVLDTLRTREPEIAWRLLCKLLPHKTVLSLTRKPLWQSWIPDSELTITYLEYFNHLNEIVNRLLSDVGENGDRWSDLIQALPDLHARAPNEVYELVFSHLASLDISTIDPLQKTVIWEHLRNTLSRHRSFPNAGWVLPPEKLQQLSIQYNRFAPQESITKYAWLFNYRPELPEGHQSESEMYKEALLSAQQRALGTLYSDSGFEAILTLLPHVNAPDVLGSLLGQNDNMEFSENELLLANLANDEEKKARFARGFINGRILNQGMEWVYQLLTSMNERLTPVQKAEILTCLQYDEEILALVYSSDPDTQDFFWMRINPYRFGSDSYLEAAQNLIEHNRPYSAICLISQNIRDSDAFPANLAMDALENALTILPEGDPLLSYRISTLFEQLELCEEADKTRVARLEWMYLYLLDSHKRSPVILHNELSNNPEFFCEVIAFVFHPEGESSTELLSEAEQERAKRGYKLFTTWDKIPGTLNDGTINELILGEWVSAVRELATNSGYLTPCDRMIGRIFAHSPSQGEIWPHPAILNIMEEISSNDLDESFISMTIDRRGVTTRMVTDNGTQERELADKYSQYADSTSDLWPRVSKLLREISGIYASFGRREDINAERRRGWMSV